MAIQLDTMMLRPADKSCQTLGFIARAKHICRRLYFLAGGADRCRATTTTLLITTKQEEIFRCLVATSAYRGVS